MKDAISWYQAASYAFRHGEMKQWFEIRYLWKYWLLKMSERWLKVLFNTLDRKVISARQRIPPGMQKKRFCFTTTIVSSSTSPCPMGMVWRFWKSSRSTERRTAWSSYRQKIQLMTRLKALTWELMTISPNPFISPSWVQECPLWSGENDSVETTQLKRTNSPLTFLARPSA